MKIEQSSFQGVMECESGFVPYGVIDPIDSGVLDSPNKRPIKINKVYGPIRVIYQPENELQGCIAKDGDFWAGDSIPQYAINIADIGNHKNSFWEYEKEWRFKLSVFSTVGARGLEPLKRETNDFFRKAMYVRFKRGIEEIVMGPETSAVEYNDLAKYLNDKDMDICIRKSDIELRDMH